MGMAQMGGNCTGNVIVGQNSRPHGVVNVMVDIGDLVRPTDDLSLLSLGNELTGMPQNAHADFVA